jgi:hypothetical protein
LQAGGRPAATSFLCFAKEKEAKKGDRTSLPCGYPSVQVKKWEMNETRLRLRQRSFLIHFLPRTNGSSEAEFLIQKQLQHQRQRQKRLRLACLVFVGND